MALRDYASTKGVAWFHYVIIALGILAIIAIILPFTGHASFGRKPALLSNVKQLDLALIMYENDYNDHAPNVQTMIGCRNDLMPYFSGGWRTDNIKPEALFYDPKSGQPIEANFHYFDLNVSNLKNPDKDMVLFGPPTGSPVNWCSGFVDGHAKSVLDEDFRNLLQHGDRPGF